MKLRQTTINAIAMTTNWEPTPEEVQFKKADDHAHNIMLVIRLNPRIMKLKERY